MFPPEGIFLSTFTCHYSGTLCFSKDTGPLQNHRCEYKQLWLERLVMQTPTALLQTMIRSPKPIHTGPPGNQDEGIEVRDSFSLDPQ